MFTFFTIEAPVGENAMDWAARMWDTFGFDYIKDCERVENFLAWPLEDNGAEKLQQDLFEAGIRFRSFEADPEKLFDAIDALSIPL